MRAVLLSLLLLLLLPALAAADNASDYLIGDGDQLQVSVWGAPELSTAVTVRPDGKITLPAVGDVQATGRTPAQLAKSLTEVFGKVMKGPVVTLSVIQVTNNRVYVAGGGVPSGVVNLTARTTLFKFLCRYETLDNTDLAGAYLLRGGKRLNLDLDALVRHGALSQDLELQPEDILFLPSAEMNRVYVLGAVNAPKFVPFRAGLRVLDAILEAQGFTDYAKENNVTVLRKNGEKIRVKVRDLIRGKDLAQNLLLAAGDYVVVEESLF
ncbi:MAG: polysaccharide biosynthesis/export family protein [Desulfuromonadales bacterium]|nr:polysaccharide biosynthesis/export family protein [Desulfuromonadales bacterium]